MNKLICTIGTLSILVFQGISGNAQKHVAKAKDEQDYKEVHWMSFDDAVKLEQQKPMKVFIDIYTPWCGWCKRMDQTTYTDSAVISYLNKHFYCVHLDAETSDTFHFNNHAFFNDHPHTRGYANELASSLMDSKMSYPTTVYMDDKFTRLTFVQSYLTVEQLMPIIKYFGDNKYLTMNYDDYKKSIDPASSGK